MTIDRVKKIISANARELQTKYSVKALFVFGSVARGSATKKSDVDILVEFKTNDIGLFEFMRLKLYLESVLGSKIDLVTRDAIKARMIAQIERDSVRVA